MPVDSGHSTTELFVRRLTIWAMYLLGYNYIEIDHSEFENWKPYPNLLLPNKVKLNINKVPITFLDKKSKSIELIYGYSDISTKKLQITLSYKSCTIHLCVSLLQNFND